MAGTPHPFPQVFLLINLQPVTSNSVPVTSQSGGQGPTGGGNGGAGDSINSSQSNTSGPTIRGSSGMPNDSAPQTTQASRDINTASLCKIGQETVQDIVSRTQEIFQTLKTIQSLIPLKEEWDMKSEERKNSEAYRQASEECKELMEQVALKNKHLKEIVDHLRRIIWEINTMLAMRRS
ncbi:conserved hypothetical protein [Pediculus humanus corporis]|uniref:Mediator of RNA polymerase II transcription subunit 30 n=1 Tax=Pediculus humanus subsp. corporis TaxID=121224 RepID=E0VHG1_PEDHC|nr:uncharacterized protein Phum_PHUM208360 [Pediculus humanus corporis]EEB12817.1 conserved hypothetical protein [Pediculus humanus corporis]